MEFVSGGEFFNFSSLQWNSCQSGDLLEFWYNTNFVLKVYLELVV